MWKTILEIKTCLQSENLQDCILKYRKSFLVLAGILGLGLAIPIYYLTGHLKPENNILQSSLTILFLGLPTFFTLWLFRTHDVQRQIDKTQENTNNSSFFECARMLAADAPSSSELIKNQYVVALEQLAYLRSETEFDKQRIDYLTQNLDLTNRDLSDARLNNLDLSNTKLNGVNLENANLDGVILEKAEIKAARFDENIYKVKLLEGAIYNHVTSFPEGFNPEEKGMIRDDT